MRHMALCVCAAYCQVVEYLLNEVQIQHGCELESELNGDKYDHLLVITLVDCLYLYFCLLVVGIFC